MTEKQFKSEDDYLHKTFVEELSYKLWSTKGARFNASSRLNKQASLSNLSLTLVSCYLILVSLFAVYKFNFTTDTTINNLLGFISVALSILILVLGQIENGKDYRLNAHLMHQCSLEIGVLYNKVRTFKTIKLKPETPEDEIIEFCSNISAQYESILTHYQNHEPIDFEKFQLQKPKYYKEIDRIKKKQIQLRYYLEVKFLFHLFIILPPILFVSIIL